MKTMGVYEAKSHFSEIIKSISMGESFVITKHGEKVAEIKPYKKRNKRKRGSLKNYFGNMSEDFDGPLPDFIDYR